MKANERDEFLRAAWRVMAAEGIDARRLVLIDECGTHTSLAPIYRWARKGERLSKKVPRNRGKNTALLVSITYGGMGRCLAVKGATTKADFEAYLERVLGPTLSLGQVVVMDNLATHKGERVRELIEGRGCELLYLPPYSPDLNPIEEAFSKVKASLRRAGVRTREALIEAMRRVVDAVTTKDTRGYFRHCGYPLAAQPL